MNSSRKLLVFCCITLMAFRPNSVFAQIKQEDPQLLAITTPEKIVLRALSKQLLNAHTIVILRTVADSVDFSEEDLRVIKQFDEIKAGLRGLGGVKTNSAMFDLKRSVELPDTLFMGMASESSAPETKYCWLIKAHVGNFYQLEDESVQRGINYKYEVIAFDDKNKIIVQNAFVKARLRENYVEKTTVESISISHLPGERKVTLSWDLNLSPEYMGAVIYRSSSEEEFMQPLSGMLQQQVFEDNSVNLGQTYYYQIRVFSSPALISRSKPIKVYVTP